MCCGNFVWAARIGQCRSDNSHDEVGLENRIGKGLAETNGRDPHEIDKSGGFNVPRFELALIARVSVAHRSEISKGADRIISIANTVQSITTGAPTVAIEDARQPVA